MYDGSEILCVDKIHSRPRRHLCVGKIGSGRGGWIIEMCVYNDIRLARTSTRPADRAGAGTAQPANIGDPLHTQKES